MDNSNINSKNTNVKSFSSLLKKDEEINDAGFYMRFGLLLKFLEKVGNKTGLRPVSRLT
jgi:hypothetical protein